MVVFNMVLERQDFRPRGVFVCSVVCRVSFFLVILPLLYEKISVSFFLVPLMYPY